MTKYKAKALNEQNISMRKIAKQLNPTHATVSRIINRYHEYNTIENLPRPEKIKFGPRACGTTFFSAMK